MKTETIRCRDLMVGDWITDNHGFQWQITNVGDDYAYATFEGNECDPWEFDDKDDQPCAIEITEDILMKNGWKEAEYWLEYQDGEATVDQMLESVVDLFRVEDKEERQRMKELISGYTNVPIKEEAPSVKIKSQDIKS